VIKEIDQVNPTYIKKNLQVIKELDQLNPTYLNQGPTSDQGTGSIKPNIHKSRTYM